MGRKDHLSELKAAKVASQPKSCIQPDKHQNRNFCKFADSGNTQQLPFFFFLPSVPCV
jgi:hypothetical protein